MESNDTPNKFEACFPIIRKEKEEQEARAAAHKAIEAETLQAIVEEGIVALDRRRRKKTPSQ